MDQGFRVRIGNAPAFYCPGDQRLVQAMVKAGQWKTRVGCRGGGCGICRLQVLEGRCVHDQLSRAHVSEAQERNGVILACRAYPRSDLVLRLEPTAFRLGATPIVQAAL